MRTALRSLIPGKLQQIYLFNQTARDQWVAHQAACVPAGARVLDVGAGSCPYRALFAHCDYRTHDFAQLSPQQLLGRTGYGTIDYVSDILSIPVSDASFDVILCTEVLEHVSLPIEAVKEFGRILRSGGQLLLSAPLCSGLHQEPYHYYGGYTPYWYQRFLPEAGFTQLTIEPNGGFFKHYGQESLRWASWLAPWRGFAQLLLSPLWLISLPWLIGAAPVGYWLDRLDQVRGFTVGYHVSAIKAA